MHLLFQNRINLFVTGILLVITKVALADLLNVPLNSCFPIFRIFSAGKTVSSSLMIYMTQFFAFFIISMPIGNSAKVFFRYAMSYRQSLFNQI